MQQICKKPALYLGDNNVGVLRGTGMKRLIGFIGTLLMPIILIAGGGMLAGLGATNDWEFVIYAGFAMIGAGILWGLVLWLWASDGGF